MKTTRKILLLLAASALCLLPSCQGTESKALTVYVVESDALYTQALKVYQKENGEDSLNLKTFPSYEALNSQLGAELMSGMGPDVLLFNSLFSDTDVLKLAASNTLLPLDELVSGLPPETYPSAFLEAGHLDGRQLLVPFSYNILQAYTRESLPDGQGYDGGMNLYEMLSAESEALLDDPNRCPMSTQVNRADVLNLFIETAGVDLINEETRALTVDREKFLEVADFVKVIYQNLDKMSSIARKYQNDFAGATSHMSFLMENFSYMNNLRYYQSVYPHFLSEEARCYTFPTLDGQDALCAQIVQYGGVNANTKNQEQAFALLRYILDTPFQTSFVKYEESTVFYAPVNSNSYDACIQELSVQPGAGPGKIASLDAENAALLAQLRGKIQSAKIPNKSVGQILQDTMEPYLLGEKDFDACFAEMENHLSLYLNE